MTYIFKLLGFGDVMTGMTYAVYIFMGAVGVIAILCLTIVITNYLKTRRIDSVSLKSKQAEKKQAEATKGLFNYDILEGDDEDFGVDITDPRNRNRQNGKHRKNLNRTPRKGLKPAHNDKDKISIQSNAPKVGLRRQQTTVNNNANNNDSQSSPNGFDYENMNGTIDNDSDSYQNPSMNPPDAYNTDGMMQFDNMSGSIQPASMNSSNNAMNANNQPMSFDDGGIQLEGMNANGPAQYQPAQPTMMNPVNPINPAMNVNITNAPVIQAPQQIPSQYVNNDNVNNNAGVSSQNGSVNPFMSNDGGGSSHGASPANPFAHIINPNEIH